MTKKALAIVSLIPAAVAAARAADQPPPLPVSRDAGADSFSLSSAPARAFSSEDVERLIASLDRRIKHLTDRLVVAENRIEELERKLTDTHQKAAGNNEVSAGIATAADWLGPYDASDETLINVEWKHEGGKWWMREK